MAHSKSIIPKSNAFDQNLSRRTFLRSMGISLALPWMPSLGLRSEATGKLSYSVSPLSPPTRFACLYFSNGVEPEHWWAREDKGGMVMGPGLAPLRSFSQDIVFLKGLFNQQAVKHPSPHLGRVPNLLSGAWVSDDQDLIKVGETMDQRLAKHLGMRTRLPSLVLGIEPTEMRLEDGLSMLYGSCISWESDTKPAMKEIYPSRVFEALVGDGTQRQLDRSVLDETLQDARSIRNRLNHRDRIKLDEYLESIRSIERRIEMAAEEESLEGWQPTLTEPNLPPPAEGLPQDIPRHMKLMSDLLVMAFQMDRTRVATYMLNNDLSQMNFGFLEGVSGSLHLDLTHNGRDPALEAMYLRTNQFHVQQLVYLMERLRSIEEGDSKLLDNCLLLFCSNLFDGDKHQADEMPMILAGGGSQLPGGRVLDLGSRPAEERRACGLYLTLMQKMGMTITSFGDADRPLDLNARI